uniref:Uncharacterized protein n=1 Tax=Arundo donax TaxID=35708 RepID=A0A0A8Y194_ARUDO
MLVKEDLTTKVIIGILGDFWISWLSR